MNETPGVVIIRAPGRINKYDGAATDGGAIFSSTPVEVRAFSPGANTSAARGNGIVEIMAGGFIARL